MKPGIFLLEAGSSFEQTVLHYYTGLRGAAKIFDPQKMPEFPKGHGIVTSKSFKVSEDGTRVSLVLKRQRKPSPQKKIRLRYGIVTTYGFIPRQKKKIWSTIPGC